MSEYATNGAMLVCTCGSAPSNLQVTSNTIVLAQGQCIATMSDKVPMTNIIPFGTCSLKPSPGGFRPCAPAPVEWIGTTNAVEAPGGKPLLKTSTIQCSCGGMISFQDSGQKRSNKIIINPSSPQITALEKASISGVPFAEECEAKKVLTTPEIINIYCIDEADENKIIYELPADKEFTLCILTRGVNEGEKINIELTDSNGRKYKGGKEKLNFEAIIEADGIAFVDKIKLEYA